jgi:alpha-glucosidase
MTNTENSIPWWQRATIYQIYPRSFKDTNGDGVGDLNGILEKLDYLADLGIQAIWLSPFYPSPMADFGYDVSDYCDVDPLFGDLATFDALLQAAHQRNIKVVIDWVPNHTSDLHPWFIEARSSLENPKRDWYIWRDPKPDGSEPNNWGSYFGGPAWTLDRLTGQYYLHQFVRQQPELNWRNPGLRAAMLDTLRFWLKRGVDGFRMDVIGLILKDEQLRDNPPDPHASADLPANDLFGRQLHIYNDDQDEVHAVIREIRKVLDEFDDRCGIGELFGKLPRWVRYYGERGDELQLPFNFRLIYKPWQAEAIRRSIDEMEVALPGFAWPNYVLGNHDQPRLASRLGGQLQARLAAMLLLTLRGTPTLYYGDELGLENGIIPPEKIQDPKGKNLGSALTRDAARTPMQWNSEPFAGFSSVEPWLPVSSDYATRNVDSQTKDTRSILNLYRQLLHLRWETPALYRGRYEALDVDASDCIVYLREFEGSGCIILLNFSAEAHQVTLPKGMRGKILLSTYLDRPGERIRKETFNGLTLRSHEGLILEKELQQ